MEDNTTDSCDFARIRRIQQGPQAPGIQLRRPDGRLCVHAGGWNGERSRRRLFPVSGDPAGLNYEDVDLSEQTPTNGLFAYVFPTFLYVGRQKDARERASN